MKRLVRGVDCGNLMSHGAHSEEACVVLVDRVGEIEQLAAAARQAARGRGRAVALVGEPGIGKTALLDLAATRAEAVGLTVRLGTADELEQRFPFAAISRSLGIRTTSTDEKAAEIARMIRGENLPGATLARGADYVELLIVEAMQALVEDLCAAHPQALLLDDMQWADDASVRALHQLAKVVAQFPLLLVLARRPTPCGPTLAQLVRSMRTDEIALGPLPPDAIVELVERLLRRQPDAELLSKVESAAGNPFFITELATAVSDHGRAPVTATVVRRLGFLSEQTQDVLRTAALLGPAVEVADLSVVLGQPASALMPLLREAISAQVLIDDDPRLVFKHDLVRQALVEEIPAAIKDALHLQAANALATAGAPPQRVAQHLRAARTLDSVTVRWLAGAADSLTARAPALAVELLQRALDLDPADRWPLVPLAGALRAAGRPEDAARAAIEALAGGHDPAAGTSLRWTLAQSYFDQGELAGALAEVEAALASSELSGSDQARFQGFAARCHFLLGDLDRAEKAALEAAKANDPAAAAYGLEMLGAVQFMHGHARKAIDLTDQAIRAMESAGREPDSPVAVHLFRGAALVRLRRLDEADMAFDAGVAMCERGVGTMESWLRLAKAQLRFVDGRWDDALVEAHAGMGGGTHSLDFNGALVSQAALIAVHRGELSASDGLAPTTGLADRMYGYLPIWLAGMRLEAAGYPGEALESLFDAWEERVIDRGMPFAQLICPDLARMAVLCGDTRRLARLNVLIGERSVSIMDATAEYCQGLATAQATLVLEAATRYEAAGWPLYRAYALEHASVLLAAEGRLDEARTALAQAVGGFAELHATWDIARAESRLREHGVRLGTRGPRSRPVSGLAALSETERMVALRVAEGLSNPQIAAQLYLSRRTVRFHVSNILAKLRLTSRVEIALEVSRAEHLR